MKLTFSDGRSIQGKIIEFEEDKINVSINTFSSKIPTTLLNEIVINQNLKLKNPPIAVQLKSGKTLYAYKFKRESGDTFLLNDRKSDKSIDVDEIQKITIK
jgi:ribosome maturation factor RimP